ncbi:MAG: hypothetical protein ACREDR_06950 [Blastocatellia bacterium]
MRRLFADFLLRRRCCEHELEGSRPSAGPAPTRRLFQRVDSFIELHRENNVEDWLTKVTKERVELEEVAYNEAKREISLRNSV